MTAAAFEKPVLGYGLKPATTFAAKQFFCAKVNTTPAWALCSVAGERVDGIIQNKATTAQEANVMVSGISKVSCGGTVAAGDSVMTDANGEVVLATKGKWAIGTMLQSGVDGDIKSMIIKPHFVPTFRFEFYIDMANIADGDLVTTFTPGFAGRIETFYWVQEAPVTTASKASTLNLEIGTTNVTGGAISLTSAACTPLGTVIASSAITAANTFTAAQTVSIEAASTTTFIEGSGTMVIEGAVRAA